MKLWVAIVATAAAALAGLPGVPASADSPVGSVVGFWAGEEFVGGMGADFNPDPESYWAPRDLSVYTEDVWDVLAEHNVPLYINLRYKRDFGPVPSEFNPLPDGEGLVRDAMARGIPVWAWITVPFTDGYWAWEGNADIHSDAVHAFIDWAGEEDLDFEGISIDSEPSIQETRELYDAFSNNPAGLADFADKTVNPERHRRAVCEYQALIDETKAAGWTMTAAAYPLSLDDLNDGLLALQDAIDVAGIPPQNWDAVYFMAYRTVYGSLFRVDPGSGLVASYMRSAAQHVGATGQVTMGVIGTSPYDQLEEVIKDVRTLATMGATRIPIYSLELTAHAFGAGGLEQVVTAGSLPYTGMDATLATAETPGSLEIRGGLAALDEAMVAATPVITADEPDGPQLPSMYPITC